MLKAWSAFLASLLSFGCLNYFHQFFTCQIASRFAFCDAGFFDKQIKRIIIFRRTLRRQLLTREASGRFYALLFRPVGIALTQPVYVPGERTRISRSCVRHDYSAFFTLVTTLLTSSSTLPTTVFAAVSTFLI